MPVMALPSLGTLSLRERPAVRTGEFASLSREQADALNDEVKVEHFTQDEFTSSQERAQEDGGSWFRVRHKYQKPDHTYGYTYYDAQSLWRWVKANLTDPASRLPIWKEDWVRLRDKYEPDLAVPYGPAYARLLSLDLAILVYDDQNRLIRKEFPDEHAQYLEGAKGEEHIVRMEWSNGIISHFVGVKNKERKVLTEFPTGVKQHYVGKKGEERLEMAVFPSGQVQSFQGPQGHEHRIEIVYNNDEGQIDELTGPKGYERLIRRMWADGSEEHFDGLKNKEWMTYRKFPDGQEQFYERPEKQLWKVIYPDGEIEWLEGEKNKEHKVRAKLPNGDEVFFTGPMGEERLVRREFADGRVKYFSGPKNYEVEVEEEGELRYRHDDTYVEAARQRESRSPPASPVSPSFSPVSPSFSPISPRPASPEDYVETIKRRQRAQE